MKEETDRACSTMGRGKGVYWILGGKPGEMRLLEFPGIDMSVLLKFI